MPAAFSAIVSQHFPGVIYVHVPSGGQGGHGSRPGQRLEHGERPGLFLGQHVTLE